MLRTSASRMVRWEARLSWTVLPTVLSCRAVSRVLVLVPVGRAGYLGRESPLRRARMTWGCNSRHPWVISFASSLSCWVLLVLRFKTWCG